MAEYGAVRDMSRCAAERGCEGRGCEWGCNMEELETVA